MSESKLSGSASAEREREREREQLINGITNELTNIIGKDKRKDENYTPFGGITNVDLDS